MWCGSSIELPIPMAVPEQRSIARHTHRRRRKKHPREPQEDESQIERPGCLARIGGLIFGLVFGFLGIKAFQNSHPWVGSFLLFVAFCGLKAAFGSKQR
jgi:hypothetical protein